MSSLAARAVAVLRASGERVATAESLTGGLLCAALVDVPGASDVVAGGVVAYTPHVKVDVLGVNAEVVAARGTVDPEVARQMAAGALERLPGTTVALATTGVAGPDPSEGHPVGTAFIAVADSRGAEATRLTLSGDRREIRDATVAAALEALVARLGEDIRHGGC